MFSDAIVGYLFLGGSGAGACFVLALLGLFVTREDAVRFSALYRRLFVPGYAAALVAIVLGVLLLVLDAGRADRIVLLMLRPRLSYITVGAYALCLSAVLALALAVVWLAPARRRPVRMRRVLEVLAVAAAPVVMVYTGMFLAGMRSVPLWETAWLPVLFALSSASCGIALVMLAAECSGIVDAFRGVFARLAAGDAVLIVLEAVAFALVVASSLYGASLCQVVGPTSADALAEALATGGALAGLDATDRAAVASVQELLSGARAGALWLGFVLVGLALPFVLNVACFTRPRAGCRQPALTALVAACGVLVGGFVMRYCLVMCGAHPQLAGMV